MRPQSTTGTEGLRRTNTGAVLSALRRLGPSTRAELAKHTGLAKATVGVIVADLEAAGYLTKIRDGRRNRYEVHAGLRLRHPRLRHRTVEDLLRFLHERE